MASPKRVGGYIDTEYLDGVTDANAEMARIMLRLSERTLPADLAAPLLRLATLLASQAEDLRRMALIRRENGHVAHS